MRASQELPGQHLFHYLDEAGEQHEVTSGDVNAYLKEIAGAQVTAKDFRTWTGTVLAALALTEFERCDTQAAAKKNVRAAIERVSARLGNTPAVCRKCYVHPEVLDSYLADELVLEIQEEVDRELRDGTTAKGTGLHPEEEKVLTFLKKRLAEKGTLAPAA